MYELRDLVAELFMEYREGIFEMELGRLAYDLLEMNPDTKIPNQMKKFSGLQRVEILRCIREGLDVEPRIRHSFNAKQMSELRQFQRHGFNVDIICNPSIPSSKMTLIRRNLIKGVNVSSIDITAYDCEQLAQIFLCIEYDLDYKQLLDPQLSAEQMADIRNKLAEERASKGMTTERYRAIHMAIFGDKIR